ncbi:MAG: DnaJ C-terminal domain-containing protein [Candidatus Melainabacteria bacterium]|nr:DnaJ C-terminal domain-containing protein [Candidatus Melainabacteria bacterium]
MSVRYKDYYKILGVSRTASEKEIKAAYRKLARKYHPDVNPAGADQFKEINEAYEVLGDPEKRRRYDSLGSNWSHGSGFEPPPGFDDLGSLFEQFRGRGAGPAPGGFGNAGGGFSDFFDLLFGAMGSRANTAPGGSGPGGSGGYTYSQYEQSVPGGGRRTQTQYTHTSQSSRTSSGSASAAANLDVEQPLLLTLEEIATDTLKTVHLQHSGKSVQVRVPKGMAPGKKIRLAGEGQTAASGQTGNAYLVVRYQPHPHFQVEGTHLLYEAQVPVYDLVLGTEIAVPTLRSGAMTLTIPPNTQAGKRFRLRGHGIALSGAVAGDLLVKVQALLPEAPSAAEIALYQQLRQAALATL